MYISASHLLLLLLLHTLCSIVRILKEGSCLHLFWTVHSLVECRSTLPDVIQPRNLSSLYASTNVFPLQLQEVIINRVEQLCGILLFRSIILPVWRLLYSMSDQYKEHVASRNIQFSNASGWLLISFWKSSSLHYIEGLTKYTCSI